MPHVAQVLDHALALFGREEELGAVELALEVLEEPDQVFLVGEVRTAELGRHLEVGLHLGLLPPLVSDDRDRLGEVQ